MPLLGSEIETDCKEVIDVSSGNSEIGRRVRLIRTSKPGTPVRPGDTGTVWRVTQYGTWRIVWDNGGKLDLDPSTDEWEVLAEQ